MVDTEWVSGLDADAACAELATAHADLLEVEGRRLLLAAHWIDLHAPADEPDASAGRGRGLPGMERTVASGADGTPQISEFACAVFAISPRDVFPFAPSTSRRRDVDHPIPYLWRSPHGYYWLTTHTGTRPLPRPIGQTLWDALSTPDDQAA